VEPEVRPVAASREPPSYLGFSFRVLPFDKEARFSCSLQGTVRRLLQLADIFKTFFETRVASSTDEIEAVLRVRYKVYCEEAAYFSPESYVDGLERDIFDDRSQSSRERLAGHPPRYSAH